MDEVILRQVGSKNRTSASEPVKRGRSVIAVIGIDNYDVWPRLNNAVADAEGVRRLFLDDLNFIELTAPLYNANATQSAINGLVQDELMNQITPDDSLVLFFAGHGHTLTRSVGESQVSTGYIIPVGGRLEAEGRFSTWLKLDSFLSDLSRLPARHVMTILDACYSGFALGQSVTVLRNYERYNTELSRRFSRQIITSAQKDQPAHDNGPLPGHSLFTGTLIEALKSQQADHERKGFVTGSELGLYVQKAVSSYSETVFRSNIIQTPGYGSFALHEQGELVIDLHGATQSKRKARECFEVAEHVMHLGRLTGDARRFAFAAAQYRAAASYSAAANLAYPEADLGLAKALFASGDFPQAALELGKLIDREGDKTPLDAWLFLGMAQAAGHQHEAAAASLHTLLDKSAQAAPAAAHRDAAWVQAFLDHLPGSQAQKNGRKLALLIGIDQYLNPQHNLHGCVSGATRLIEPILIERCGFQPGDIISLMDTQATRQNVLSALEELVESAAPQDSVLVYFSGHAIGSADAIEPEKNPENIYLILNDTVIAQKLSNGISARQLHDCMQAIPAGVKTLILDTHSSQELTSLVSSEGSYAMLCASDSAELAYEVRITINGSSMLCGMLTAGIYEVLERAADPANLTFRELVDPVKQWVYQFSLNKRYSRPQNPYFVGLPELHIFGGDDPYQAAFRWVQTGMLCLDSPEELVRRYRWFNSAAGNPPAAAHAAFGRAFFANAAYPQAAMAYQQAVADPAGVSDPDLWRALGAAHLRAGDLTAARAAFETYLPHASPSAQQDIAAIFQSLERVHGRKRSVILFLIGKNQSISPQQKKQIKQLLLRKFGQQFGFDQPSLQIRTGQNAGLAAVTKILQQAGSKGPCLIGLLGIASNLDDDESNLELNSLVFDSQSSLDIEQLTQAVQNQPNLLVWLQPERSLV